MFNFGRKYLLNFLFDMKCEKILCHFHIMFLNLHILRNVPRYPGYPGYQLFATLGSRIKLVQGLNWFKGLIGSMVQLVEWFNLFND